MPGELVESSHLVIKMRFKGVSSSSYGIMVAVLNALEKRLEKMGLIASHFSAVGETNLQTPWYELDTMINNYKWKGEFAKTLTNDISNAIEDIFQNSTKLNDIINLIKKDQFYKVGLTFEEALARITADKGIKCEIVVEATNAQKLEELKRQREQTTATATPTVQPQEQNVDVQNVYIDVTPVLAPVNGIMETDLKIGDKIFVKIADQSSRGMYYVDFFNANVNGEIVPIPATFLQYIREGKTNTLIVNLAPGINGKAVHEDVLKVKLYDPSQDKRTNITQMSGVPQAPQTQNIQQNISTLNETKANINFYFLIVAIGVFLILIILIIYSLL